MTTTPYYQDDLVTLYHGSNLDILEWLQADVLITDPPYGTDPEGNGYGRSNLVRKQVGGEVQAGAFTIANDGDTVARDKVLELWGDRPALLFGSPRLPDPPTVRPIVDRLVWDKKRPGINGGPWRYRHESIYVTAGFVRPNDASVSILTAFPQQQYHMHEKPVPLMTALIECAPEGLVIADPFSGSCSTLVAAHVLGRRAIGVELEEAQCENLAIRLEKQAKGFHFEAEVTEPSAWDFDDLGGGDAA